MAKSITVEQAQAVLGRWRDQQRKADVTAKRAMVGKCYRYHNTFGDGKRWWLYTKVVSVNRWGHFTGLSFQAKSDHTLEIELRAHLSLSGWTEISEEKYEAEKAKFVRLVVKSMKAVR